MTGAYYLHGVTEIASGFKLNSDSTFEFFFIYGALDRFGSGKWFAKGDEIHITSRPKPSHDFKLLRASRIDSPGTVVQIVDSNRNILSYVEVTLFSGGTAHRELTDSHGMVQFPELKADSLTLRFEFTAERESVFVNLPREANQFEFGFEPWLVEVFFEDLVLKHDGKALTGQHPLLIKGEYNFEKAK